VVADVVTLHQRLRALHLEVGVERRRPEVVHVAHGGVSDVTAQAGASHDLGGDTLRYPQGEDLVSVFYHLVRQTVSEVGWPEHLHECLKTRVGGILRLSRAHLPADFRRHLVEQADQFRFAKFALEHLNELNQAPVGHLSAAAWRQGNFLRHVEPVLALLCRCLSRRSQDRKPSEAQTGEGTGGRGASQQLSAVDGVAATTAVVGRHIVLAIQSRERGVRMPSALR